MAAAPRKRRFNAEAFLKSAGTARIVTEYPPGAVIFAQGATADSVFYLQKGAVKLSVLSKNGREAVIAILEAGNFFGEGCLAGQPVRMGNAVAASASVVMRIRKEPMLRLLHTERAFSDRFITHMLARNIRVEED